MQLATGTVNSRNLPAYGESPTRADDFLSPRIVAREAAKIVAAVGIEIRPAALRRLVTRFIHDGRTSLLDLERMVIGYADPTGETAVRNVIRGGRD